MINEYLGNNTYKYTLSTGKEIILTDDELDELMTENDEYQKSSVLRKDLDEAIEYIDELECEKRQLEQELDEQEDEIIKLGIIIEDLRK